MKEIRTSFNYNRDLYFNIFICISESIGHIIFLSYTFGLNIVKHKKLTTLAKYIRKEQ